MHALHRFIQTHNEPACFETTLMDVNFVSSLFVYFYSKKCFQILTIASIKIFEISERFIGRFGLG